jgi:hypothetical protein
MFDSIALSGREWFPLAEILGCFMSLLVSVYSLAKSNNGMFKSEKQAAFLIAELERRNGLFVECFSFGEFNGASANREVQVTWDNQGIVRITTKAPKSGKTSIKFERKTDTEYQAIKEAKALEIQQGKQQAIADFKALIVQEQAKIVEAETMLTLLSGLLAEGKIEQVQFDVTNRVYQPKIEQALSDIENYKVRMQAYS